jgi:hypothetical protein
LEDVTIPARPVGPVAPFDPLAPGAPFAPGLPCAPWSFFRTLGLICEVLVMT